MRIGEGPKFPDSVGDASKHALLVTISLRISLSVSVLQVIKSPPIVGGEDPAMPSEVMTSNRLLTHSPLNALPRSSEKKNWSRRAERERRAPAAAPALSVGIEKVMLIVSRKEYTLFRLLGSLATRIDTLGYSMPQSPYKAKLRVRHQEQHSRVAC